jgi:glycosyltransferase involved in cell wall biosynthesis
MIRAAGSEPPPLKVVHVIGGLGVGGAEMALLALAKGFQGTEVECRVFALGVEGGMRSRFEEAGIPLTCFDLRRRPLGALWGLFRALRRERPDVLQTWLYHADLIGGLLGRLVGCRAILWGIHSIGLAKEARFSTRLVQRLCARLSWWVPHRILCVATASKTAHAAVGYDARRMVIQPNGYDFARMVPSEGARARLRTAWKIPPGARVVGTVGRFCEEKDYPTFIRATARIAAGDPALRILLVGRGLDSGNPALARAIGETGHGAQYILAGERGDIPDCLAAMDVFGLSSRMEAFPNVLVEAMAAGLPCVSTDVGDAAIILREAGVLVGKEDAPAFAEGLRSLLERSEAELAAIGSRARAQVTSEFSIQKGLETMRCLYLEMLERDKS